MERGGGQQSLPVQAAVLHGHAARVSGAGEHAAGQPPASAVLPVAQSPVVWNAANITAGCPPPSVRVNTDNLCGVQRGGGKLSEAEARSILIGLGPALPPPTMAGLEGLKTAVPQILPEARIKSMS